MARIWMCGLTSEIAVVSLDYLWQQTIDKVCNLKIYLNDKHDSSQIRLRPNFVAMASQKMLLVKGEAKKASSGDLSVATSGLTKKYYPDAYKLFPQGCNSIPSIVTSDFEASIRAISYVSNRFVQTEVKTYKLDELNERVDFIVDIFKICHWIHSQKANPQAAFHLVPEIRTKTRNDNHVTWLKDGIEKEFSASRAVPLETIGVIYSHKLPNIEHGSVNRK